MIIDKEKVLQHYEENWQKKFDSLEHGWLPTLRRHQFELFLSKGFPSSKDENWKYTNLAALKKQLFDMSIPSQLVKKEGVENLQLKDSSCRLVFLDGHYQEHLSKTEHSKQFIICSLATALKQHEALVQPYLAQQQEDSTFINLNTACFQDGSFIHVSAHCQIKEPVHLIFLSSSNTLQNVRNVIVVESHAQVTFFEEHRSLTEDAYFANIFTQVDAKENSQVKYIKLQEQNNCSFHIANTQITQESNSHVIAYHYNLGGQIAREDITGFLNEKEASLQLQGLYLAFKNQHMDIHTLVHHLADRTMSEEQFKGVIASKSRAVFNGKICVGKNIKKTVANLQNKNLLLARDAEINTKPELEIYSDDVKCKHGATIGQIDTEMLFYMRSRGIPQEKAYQLLLLAFVREQLSAITPQAVAEKILFSVTKNCEEVIQ